MIYIEYDIDKQKKRVAYNPKHVVAILVYSQNDIWFVRVGTTEISDDYQIESEDEGLRILSQFQDSLLLK